MKVKLQKRPSTVENDMKLYHRSINWMEWWEEWLTALSPNGLPRFKYVSTFANAKSRLGTRQNVFIKWYIGEKDANPDLDAQYPWAKPQCWATKRSTGGWYTEETLRLAAKETVAIADNLAILTRAGRHYLLPSLIRLERLAQELDSAFQGRFFVEELDLAANMVRAKAYLAMHGQIIALKDRAADQYAKSLGINFDDMSGLGQLITASALAAQVNNPVTERSRTELALSKLVEMSMVKSARYSMPLPDDASKVIVDVTAQDEEKTTNKKRMQ